MKGQQPIIQVRISDGVPPDVIGASSLGLGNAEGTAVDPFSSE